MEDLFSARLIVKMLDEYIILKAGTVMFSLARVLVRFLSCYNAFSPERKTHDVKSKSSYEIFQNEFERIPCNVAYDG